MEHIQRIGQLDPGDENCENFAFVPYPHRSPNGSIHTPSSTTLIRLNDVTERYGTGYWTCSCGAELEFAIPLDSDLD